MISSTGRRRFASCSTVERRIGLYDEIGSRNSQSFRPHLNLSGRFFAGAVQHRAGMAAHGIGNLQHQGRFADTGVAAQQDQRSRHDAAAQHAVQFADARPDAAHLFHGDILQQGRLRPLALPRADAFRRFRHSLFFHHRIPFSALGAPAQPAAGHAAAVSAYVSDLRFSHQRPPIPIREGLKTLPALEASARASTVHDEPAVHRNNGLSRRI